MHRTFEQEMNRRMIGNIFRSTICNLIDWYDWFTYVSLAVYFAPQFFPHGDLTSQLLKTSGIFAVGFLMRPLGSYFLGGYADRHGRRAALILSVSGMAFGSLLIGASPTYESIGVLSPLLLVMARLIQGLSVGGEYAATATYLAEVAKKGSRGFYSSFQYVTIILGQVISLGLVIILLKCLGQSQMTAWAWRIPFFIGAMAAIWVFWLLRSMDESEPFANMGRERRANAGTMRVLWRHHKAVLTVVGLTLGGTIGYYTYTTYMLHFMINTAKINHELANWINFFALIIFALMQPVAGAFSDRIGRRPLLMGFGILGTSLTVPLFMTMQEVQTPFHAFLLMMVGLVILTGYTSINAIVKAELFPVEIRVLGVGLPYALTVTIFGGTVEFVALWMKSMGVEQLFYFYVAGCMAVSLIVYCCMGETSKVSAIEVERVRDH